MSCPAGLQPSTCPSWCVSYWSGLSGERKDGASCPGLRDDAGRLAPSLLVALLHLLEEGLVRGRGYNIGGHDIGVLVVVRIVALAHPHPAKAVFLIQGLGSFVGYPHLQGEDPGVPQHGQLNAGDEQELPYPLPAVVVLGGDGGYVGFVCHEPDSHIPGDALSVPRLLCRYSWGLP